MLNHHSDCKLKKVYIVNRIYKVGNEKFSSVVFVSFDEKKAWEQLERLKKVIDPNHELLEVIARTIDDTFIVDTIIETAPKRNTRNRKIYLSSMMRKKSVNKQGREKKKKVRNIYAEILEIWGRR